MSDRGVYRLATAMLVQALQDVASSSMGRRSSAMRWINSTEDSSFSFTFVCRILSRDPHQVRQFCERKAAERRATSLDRERMILREQLSGYWSAGA